jgi:hypothetical protein
MSGEPKFNPDTGGVTISGTSHIAGDVVGRDKITIVAPVSPKATSLHQLPPPVLDFTGRVEELERILATAQSQSSGVICFQGLPGVGKTSLALKLAEKLRAAYLDA